MRKSCKSPDKCPCWSDSLNRCVQGYTDPKRIGQGVNAAAMGLLRPCPWTERGKKVLERLNMGA